MHTQDQAWTACAPTRSSLHVLATSQLPSTAGAAAEDAITIAWWWWQAQGFMRACMRTSLTRQEPLHCPLHCSCHCHRHCNCHCHAATAALPQLASEAQPAPATASATLPPPPPLPHCHCPPPMQCLPPCRYHGERVGAPVQPTLALQAPVHPAQRPVSVYQEALVRWAGWWVLRSNQKKESKAMVKPCPERAQSAVAEHRI